MQARRDEVVDLRVRHLGAQRPEQTLGSVAEHAGGGARNGVHRLARRDQAVVDGARELTIEQQELDNACGGDAAVPLAVHLERAGRLQHRGPLNVVGRRADIGGRGQQEKVLAVENARRLSARSSLRPNW